MRQALRDEVRQAFRVALKKPARDIERRWMKYALRFGWC